MNGYRDTMTTSIIPLGTASALPANDRHLSALALKRKGRVLLFDCGEGTQYRLLDAGLKRTRVDAVFVTHLHGDHCYGLPGLLETLALQQRTEPVTLVVPAGGREMLEVLSAHGRFRSSEALPFPLEISEVEEDLAQATVYETDEVEVRARPLEHSTFTMGFRFEERPRPGRFDPQRARALGVPEGPAFGRLQDGHPVTVEEGTTVHPEQVLGPPRPGISVAYVTDTRPCPAGRALAADADVLYHDATFTDRLHDRALETKHSTAREAAEVARAAEVNRLLLGHVSARYPELTPLEEEARAVFSRAEAAEELYRYELDPRENEVETD